MRTSACVAALAVLLLAGSACSGGDAGGSTEGEEISVEAYASQTHGAIRVESASPNPADWFDVLRNGTRAVPGNPPLLGSTLEVPPGNYQVVVNRTERTVSVEAGQQVVLRTGDLLVEGEPYGSMWYPAQNGDRKLVSNPPILGSWVALFPGSYDVTVYEGVGVPIDSLGVAEVRPGRVTTLRR